jgi:hypothetical protein
LRIARPDGKTKTLIWTISIIDHAMMEAGDTSSRMPDNADPKPRTIDERLDGLTQTVEIITSMQRDNEKRFAEIAKIQEQDGEHIRALARIAEIHERRLSDLEDQQQ